jgi:hypothetical protein
MRKALACCLLTLAGMPAVALAQSNLPPSAALLLRYDADMDGSITRAEMEAGVKGDYSIADADHNNCLNPVEVRAENDRRLKRDAGQATPLVDWNLDGCVNLAEFGGTARSYFTFADRTKDGSVSQTELRGPAMPLPIPVQGKNGQPQQGQASKAPVDPGVSY